jgi:tRNA 2-selenouridine synthase
MRSAGMAWLFDLYGFQVYIVVGGYKAFRTWALENFELPYDIKVVGGYTGSSKTELLHEIKNNREAVIDLEGIALHKGSAFGGIGLAEQPTQEMFENILAIELFKMNENGKPISFWIEDESQRIGRLNIPNAFWKTIRAAPLYFIDIDFETRLDFIISYYGKLNKEALVNAILRIQKRLGPNETKLTINFILENNIKEAFRILLQYYDKTYFKSLQNREELESQMKKISMTSTNATLNYQLLHQFINQQ